MQFILYCFSSENVLYYRQDPLVAIFFLLITFLLENVMILKGEISNLPFWAVKGLRPSKGR